MTRQKQVIASDQPSFPTDEFRETLKVESQLSLDASSGDDSRLASGRAILKKIHIGEPEAQTLYSINKKLRGTVQLKNLTEVVKPNISTSGD